MFYHHCARVFFFGGGTNDQADAKWRNLIYFVSHPRKLVLVSTAPSAFPVAAVIPNNV